MQVIKLTSYVPPLLTHFFTKMGQGEANTPRQWLNRSEITLLRQKVRGGLVCVGQRRKTTMLRIHKISGSWGSSHQEAVERGENIWFLGAGVHSIYLESLGFRTGNDITSQLSVFQM